MKTKYIIKDWAGNELDYTGIFKSVDFSVAMEFSNIEEALEYIQETMPEDSFDDIYVIRKGQ